MIDKRTSENRNDTVEGLKKIIEEKNKMKDKITACEWCGMTYPKGGWKYYKIHVRNMSLEKIVDQIEKGIDDIDEDNFDEHIICSDCYDHLKECKEC